MTLQLRFVIISNLSLSIVSYCKPYRHSFLFYFVAPFNLLHYFCACVAVPGKYVLSALFKKDVRFHMSVKFLYNFIQLMLATLIVARPLKQIGYNELTFFIKCACYTFDECLQNFLIWILIYLVYYSIREKNFFYRFILEVLHYLFNFNIIIINCRFIIKFRYLCCWRLN